jgi:hypothetical protein
MFSRVMVLAGLFASVAAGGARADVVEVTGWQVNVRERPSRSAPVIVTLYRGERFDLIERAGSWYHVRMVSSGQVGYVHSSLVRVIPGAAVPAAEPETPRPEARPAPTAEPPTEEPPAAPAPRPRVQTAPAPAPPPPQSPAPVPETPEATADTDSQEREGFWIGLGAGYGSASASSDSFSGGDREGSFTGYLKLGGTLNPQLLIGVESNAWVKSEAGVTLTLGNASGTVTYYPRPTSAFFVKGGVGLSYVSTEISLFGEKETVSKTGWGLLFGMGYDWRVGRNVSVTPSFNFYYGRPGDITFEGERFFKGWRQNVMDIGLGVTFH